MSKKENKNLLLNVCNIAIEAGIIINEFFNSKTNERCSINWSWWNGETGI